MLGGRALDDDACHPRVGVERPDRGFQLLVGDGLREVPLLEGDPGFGRLLPLVADIEFHRRGVADRHRHQLGLPARRLQLLGGLAHLADDPGRNLAAPQRVAVVVLHHSLH